MALPPTLHRIYYRQRSNPMAPESTTGAPGLPRKACGQGSVWDKYAFNSYDKGKELVVTKSGSMFALSVDGVIRTEIANASLDTCVPSANQGCDSSINSVADLVAHNWTIHTVTDSLGSELRLHTTTAYCQDSNANLDTCSASLLTGNPLIHFQAPDLSRTFTWNVNDVTFVAFPQKVPDQKLVMTEIKVACTEFVVKEPHYVRYNNEYFRHDPRIETLNNNRTHPAQIQANQQSCPAVAHSFLNDGALKCKRQDSCAPKAFASAPFMLNSTMIRKIFTLTKRYVYYMDGLRQESEGARDPCTTGNSRWRKSAGACIAETTFANTETRDLIRAALNASTDVYNTAGIRDINLKSYKSTHGGTCTGSSGSSRVMGSHISLNSECWENVHYQLYNVYDLSDWVLFHQGNNDAKQNGHRNPIAKWAEDGSARLPFPSWHGMDRWLTRHTKVCCMYMGRLGDVVDFKELRTEVQSLELAQYVGATGYHPSDGFEACGSPGEVKNEPTLGHYYGTYLGDEYTTDRTGVKGIYHDYKWENGKKMVWTNIALKSADQLRQRVSWALSQQFVVGTSGSTKAYENEVWHVYYDIFVRNAFGNLRDIMREVSYSALMGDYLTYLGTYPGPNP